MTSDNQHTGTTYPSWHQPGLRVLPAAPRYAGQKDEHPTNGPSARAWQSVGGTAAKLQLEEHTQSSAS